MTLIKITYVHKVVLYIIYCTGPVKTKFLKKHPTVKKPKKMLHNIIKHILPMLFPLIMCKTIQRQKDEKQIFCS